MSGADIIARLEKEITNKTVRYSVTGKNCVIVEINADNIRAGVSALFKDYQPRFVTLVAVDNGLDIELKYNFSIDDTVVILSTTIPKETSQIETITDIVPAAEFIEKEVSELFGLSFAGHPREASLVLPDNWVEEKKPMGKPMSGILPLSATKFEVQNLLASGSAIGILKTAIDKREGAGLPELPVAGTSEESIRDFQELIKRSGFGKRAGYDWEKGKLRYR